MRPRRTSEADEDAADQDDEVAFLAQQRSHLRPRTKRDVKPEQRAWEARSLRKVRFASRFLRTD